MPSSAFAPRSEGPRTPKREKPAENERRHKPMRMFGFGTRKNRLSEGGNKTEDLALPSSPKHDTPRRRGWMPAFFASRVSKQSRYVKRSQVEADKVAVEEPNAHAQMKMRLAALDVQRGRLLRQISVTGAAITDATDASKQLRDYVGFMLEDFRIDLHKPAWMAAIYAVAEFAALNSVNALRETGKDAAGRTLVPLASEMLLQLRKAEPSIEPHSAILLIRNEKSHGALGVVAATAAAAEQSQRAKNGAIWKPTSPNPLSMESFKVLTSERALLRSPHGTVAEGLSMAPLLQRDGRAFGVLISGRPAVPDELLRGMAITAGPLLERVWKWNKVNAMMRVATTWVGKLSPKLRDACWLTGEKSSRSRKRSGHAPPPWQPLFFVSGDNMEAFELELRWTSTTLAATLGTMKVVLPAGETLCATTLEILQATGAMLQDAIEEIERMPVGEPAPLGSDDDFHSTYDATRLLLPRKLHAEMQLKLSELKAENVFAELRGYSDTRGVSYTKPMGGVLVLLGRPMPKAWPDVRELLTRQTLTELLEFDLDDLAVVQLRRRLASSLRATKGIDLDEMLPGMATPVQAMTRWMLAVRLVMQVVITIHEENEGAPSEEADAEISAEDIVAELKEAGEV